MTAKEVSIGVIADLTGPTAAVQVPFTEGIKTQVEAINDAGGINGRKIKILDEDDKGEVPVGVAAYKKLVSQTPVVGISGLNGSSIQEAALKLIEKDNMPLVGPQSTVKGGLVPLHKSIFFAMRAVRRPGRRHVTTWPSGPARRRRRSRSSASPPRPASRSAS